MDERFTNFTEPDGVHKKETLGGRGGGGSSFLKLSKIQALNQGVNHAPDRFLQYPHQFLRKKHCLVGIVRTKMYLFHSEILMPKDTKSLGNNKPACESRGFVRKKKEGVHFDTPSKNLIVFFCSVSYSGVFYSHIFTK